LAKKGGKLVILTIKAKIHPTPQTEAVLKDAMRCATKVYNGLLWHLRKEYEETGKTNISRKNLNQILKELPRTKGYYSMSVQLTRDEVIQAYQLPGDPVVDDGKLPDPLILNMGTVGDSE
jgi:transposase